MNKITCEEYRNNPELLKVVEYIPYDAKITIIDSILKELVNNESGFYTLDSVLLDRIKVSIYIHTYTNIDLNFYCENLDGYDYMCKHDLVDEIISKFSKEYERLESILSLRIKDFYLTDGSLRGLLSHKINYIVDGVSSFGSSLENLNTSDIKNILDGFNMLQEK